MSKSNTQGLAHLPTHIVHPHTIPKHRIVIQHLGEFSFSQVHFLHLSMKLKRHDPRAGLYIGIMFSNVIMAQRFIDDMTPKLSTSKWTRSGETTWARGGETVIVYLKIGARWRDRQPGRAAARQSYLGFAHDERSATLLNKCVINETIK